MFLRVSDPLLTNTIITREAYVVTVFGKVYPKKRLLTGYSKFLSGQPGLDNMNKLRVIGHLSKDRCPALSRANNLLKTTNSKPESLLRSTRHWSQGDLGYATPLFLKRLPRSLGSGLIYVSTPMNSHHNNISTD